MRRIAPLLTALAILFSLTGCTAHTPPNAAGGTPDATGGVFPATSQSPAEPTPTASPSPAPGPDWLEHLTAADLPQTAASPAEILKDLEGQVYLLADLPEPDISLYGIGGAGSTGILIRHGEALTYFDQQFLPSSNPILPEYWWRDFDGDGQNELALKYLMTSSTQAQVFALHIYEQDGDGWTDHVLLEQDINDQLAKAVVCTTDPQSGLLTLVVDGSAMEISPDNLPSPPQALDYPLYFTGQTFYRYENGRFSGVYGIGVLLEQAGQPWYAGQILADVTYNGTDFSLTNLRIDAYFV